MSDEIFRKLFEGLTTELVRRIEEGTASATDLNVARQWLNDNKYAADPRTNGALKALDKSISSLPFDA